MAKRNLVVLTGAGVSAESGLKTFRDGGGLWEGYRVEEVATPRAWQMNPELVLRFYNERRRSLRDAAPNAAHLALAQLEEHFAVSIITQNVDDLHERAGSTRVIHLHGELCKARSSVDEGEIVEIGYRTIEIGETCSRGSQLRPHIVWFGEAVPLMDKAIEEAREADIFAVIGTSLVVYPAAGLVDCVADDAPIFVIDPKRPELTVLPKRVQYLIEKASTGVPKMADMLTNLFPRG